MPPRAIHFSSRTCGLMLIALLALVARTVLADTEALGATAQIGANASNDQSSPANVVSGPDFQTLMKLMRRNIGACGVPRTATLQWHVMPDGVIDSFVLNRSSGDACFDQIVTLNADAVIKAQLRITPATRNGIAEAAWVPFAVAARD